MTDSASAPKVFSLYEVQQHLRHVIGLNMRRPIWVEAELAELSQSRSGVYLSLIQREGEEVCASAQAMIWLKEVQALRKSLGEDLGHILQKGRALRMKVRIEYSERYGLKYRIEDIDAAYSIGQMELQRLANIRQIYAEGLAAPNKALTLPTLLRRIALISSTEAAGRVDFEEQLRHNPYGLGFQLKLYPAAMQGQRLEAEVIARLEEAAQSQAEVIVLTRGGGSRLDLSGFDSLALCRAIAACPKPVITGIGHEIDESLADLVAHTSLKTPTAAAEFIIGHNARQVYALQQSQMRLEAALARQIQLKGAVLSQIQTRLPLLLQQQLSRHQARLQALQTKVELLDPKIPLKRGYALVYKEGLALQSLQGLQKGQRLRLELGGQSIEVLVD